MNLEAGELSQSLKMFRLHDKHKKLMLDFFLLLLDITSILLDVFGRSSWPFLLVALVLSTLSFFIPFCSNRKKGRRFSTAERQLQVLGFVWSGLQLITTFVLFVMALSGVNISYDIAFAFPLVSTIIDVYFAIKYDQDPYDQGYYGISDIY